jgi:WD40 repeat protein
MAQRHHRFLLAAALAIPFLLLWCIWKWLDNLGVKPNQLGKAGQVKCLAFSPDSDYLAVGSFVEGKEFVVWDVESRKEVFSAEGCPFAMAFSPDGKSLALKAQLNIPPPTEEEERVGKVRSGDPGIILMDTTTWKRTKSVAPSAVYSLYSLAFHPNEDWLFVTGAPKSRVAGTEHFLLSWDLKAGMERYRKAAHSFTIEGLAVSPDGRTVVTAAAERSVAAKIWEAATGKELWSIPRLRDGEKLLYIRPVAFLPDNSTLATGWSDGRVRLWDLKTRKEKAGFSGEAVSGSESLAVSSDGRILVMASYEMVEFWEVATSKQLAKLKVPRVNHVALSPDGKWLATGSAYDKSTDEDGFLALWKMADVLRKKSD